MLNDIAILDRFYSHGMLNQPVKKLATVSRCPAIEAKRKFIKIVIQMLKTNSTLVSAKYPVFQKRHNTVYARQKLCSRSAGAFNYSNFMSIPVGFQAAITFPTIGSNNATRFNCAL